MTEPDTEARDVLVEAAQRFLDAVYAARPSWVLENDAARVVEDEQRAAAVALRVALAATGAEVDAEERELCLHGVSETEKCPECGFGWTPAATHEP